MMNTSINMVALNDEEMTKVSGGYMQTRLRQGKARASAAGPDEYSPKASNKKARL